MKAMFHDDSCGKLLNSEGLCPGCGFHPDMQSTSFREVTSDDRVKFAGCMALGLGRVPFRITATE